MKFFVNFLTFLRIPITFILSYLIIYKQQPFYLSLALMLFVFLTDILDGKLARKYKVETDFGAKLDVVSDFIFTLVLSLSYSFVYKFPKLILGIIIFKFIEFNFTSYLIRRNIKRNHIYLFDKLGKYLAIYFYILPLIILIMTNFFPLSYYKQFIEIVSVISAFVAVLASILRIKKIITYFKCLWIYLWFTDTFLL